jgi:gamma-glutamyltranspeptidase/glutathione hydrolase
MRFFALFAALLVAGPAIPSLCARQPVRARKAMVAAQEWHATDVGVAVLKSGGNAVDAAVAVAMTLAVTHPTAGNLGGGGFLLLRKADGATTFLDFRERAPAAASHDMYLDAAGNPTADSIDGWRASAVPGTVRGMEYAHKKYGSKPWAELFQPAIELATKGFPVTWSLARDFDRATLLPKYPESRRIFLKNGAKYEIGETFVQPELAHTLQRIARNGANEFYEGETAHKLAAAMKANGGLITAEDLSAYKVSERKPITGRYKDYDIISAPPPSSGGIGLLQMMGVLEGSEYERAGAGSAAATHFVAEAMRRFYADRSEYLADPDFFRVPTASLLNRDYIARLRASIDPNHATPSGMVKPGSGPGFEHTETTHFSIVDAEGNAVAMTYTLNGSFGSGVTIPGLGFLMNNEMDDFSAKPGASNMFGLVQGESNAIQPGKRPLSAMTPTIVLHNGKPYIVIGAPGGSRIITGVMQVILNVIDFKMNIQEAIDQPRFHHQWRPDRLYLERGFSPDTIALLKARGHDVEENTFGVALVEGILIDGGWLQGGSDGRANGKAAGY